MNVFLIMVTLTANAGGLDGWTPCEDDPDACVADAEPTDAGPTELTAANTSVEATKHPVRIEPLVRIEPTAIDVIPICTPIDPYKRCVGFTRSKAVSNTVVRDGRLFLRRNVSATPRGKK